MAFIFSLVACWDNLKAFWKMNKLFFLLVKASVELSKICTELRP